MAHLVWKGLTVSVKSKNGKGATLLSDVNGCVGPGDLLAIMGPSGSSKTTLLDVLAGRISSNLTRSGTILLNGHESNLSYGVAAYVKQTDELIGTLSVRETLLFVARLRLPAVSDDKVTREQRVEDVINELGLKDAANVPVGSWFIKGISGGQKRRLSIGCELLVSPALLFLDEPTSGLDAASAYFVMKGIRELAAKGRTILSVIHQPSSEVFELFEKLCLLSTGKLVYFGEAIRAIDLFNDAGLPCPDHRNPADHFLQCTNRDFDLIENDSFTSVEGQIRALTDTFEKSEYKKAVVNSCQELSVERERYKGPSKRSRYLERAYTLTWRSLVDYWRNIGVFWMRVAMYVMLCICIGTVYFDMGTKWIEVQSRASLMFFVTAFLTFMAISAFPAYMEELQVYTREVLNGYYPTSAYVIASTISSAPFIFLIAISSTVCAYFLAGLRSDTDSFFYFVLNLFMALMTTESMFLCIGAVLQHYLIAIAGAAGVMGLYMLVCGFFQARDELPDPVWKYPLHYVSFHTYAFTGLMNNEFSATGEKWDCPCTLTQGEGTPGCKEGCKVSGEDVLASFTIEHRDKWIEIGVLVGMFVFYRLLFLIILKLREHRQKSK